MEDKLKALTDKLLKEGVEQGEKEAQAKVAAAEAEAAKIISDAKAEAAQIVAKAKKEAEELARNNQTEVKLASQKMIAQLKQQIVDLTTTKMLSGAVGASLDDAAVMGALITSAVAAFAKNPDADLDLAVLLPEDKKAQLEGALKVALKKQLDAGLTIAFVKGIKGGFKIGPQNGTYTVTMSDQDFAELFSSYIRPASRKLLFGE